MKTITTRSRRRLLTSVIAGAAVLSVAGAGTGIAAAANHSPAAPTRADSVGMVDHSRDAKLDRTNRDSRDRHSDSRADTSRSGTSDRSVDRRPDR